MADNDDNEPKNYAIEDEQENGVFRWMSAVVVLLALAGFFGLAWYAYKSGGEAMSDKDVELIKADKTPVKEAPANPGGMDIPNQDKTVYGLVGGKTEKPTVERILPAPETPVVRTSDTDTWMSDKLKGKVVGSESHEAEVKAASSPPSSPTASDTTAPKAEQFNPAKIRSGEETVNSSDSVPDSTVPAATTAPVVTPPDNTLKVTGAAPIVAPPVKAVPKAEVADSEDGNADVKPAAPAKVAVAKAPEAKSLPVKKLATNSGKGVRIQLGAYKSQSEAEANWKRIAKKFPDETSGQDHYVVRADLGDKGVFYRLQAGSFASPKDAESFCTTLVSQSQGCFTAKAK